MFADPFAEADEDTGQIKQSQQDYIHIRIQRTCLPRDTAHATTSLAQLSRLVACKPLSYTALPFPTLTC